MDHSRDYKSVSISVDDSDPRDSAAHCDRCGKSGTIARTTRHSEPPLTLRFCGDCWPIARSELEIRQKEESEQWRMSRGDSPPPPAWTGSSRSWYDVIQFLHLIEQPTRGGPPPTEEDFAMVASEIRAKAGEMSGAMPAEVELFLKRYSPPAS